MRRIASRKVPGPFAWLLALGITGGVLTGFFSVAAPELLSARWPLGITPVEVEHYAAWLDRRPSPDAGRELEQVVFACREGCQGLRQLPVECEMRRGERSMRVELSPVASHPGALLVRVLETTDRRDAGAFVLLPADAGSIRYKYLQVLAEEAGLLSPEVSWVRLSLCGEDHGTWTRVPVVDSEWLARHGVADGIAYTQGFDPDRLDRLVPTVDADPHRTRLVRGVVATACGHALAADHAAVAAAVDRERAMAWLLMVLVEGRPDPLHRNHCFAYREAGALIMPVFCPAFDAATARSIGAPSICDPFTALLADDTFIEAARAHRDALAEQAWRIRDRFATIDATWLPMLTNGSYTLAKAQARRVQDSLLTRLAQARFRGGVLDRDPVAPPPLPLAAQAGVVAAAGTPASSPDGRAEAERLAKRYRLRLEGDTLFFPRGKYKVAEEDLVLPPGFHAVLLPGARFEMGAERSVVVRGSLVARGTRLNPVFVRAEGTNRPFAAFTAQGDGTSMALITGLRISGGRGSGGAADGMFNLRGMAATRIEGCTMEGDGTSSVLVVEGGALELRGTQLTNGTMVLRQVRGLVEDLSLRVTERRATAGGVRIEGGRVALRNVGISGVPGDAVRATDAAQVLLSACTVERSATAVAGDALAVLHVDACRFTGNGTVLHLIDGDDASGALAFLYANELSGNEREVESGPASRVERRDQPPPGLVTGFGLP